MNRQRNTPPRWMVDQELQELREEMAWMRSRLSAPSQGSKGKGKGKGQAKPKPKGASQGVSPPATATQASSQGPARRRPNLKPNEERAAPTLDRDQVPEMPGIQLDQSGGLQILRNTLSQATGCIQQLCSTITAGGQATRHYTRQVLCGCRRRLPSNESVRSDLGQGRPLQTPGGIGNSDWDTPGRVPSENGAFHSAGLCQREIEGPQAAGSQARFGNSRGEEGHRQAGKGRRSFEAGTGGIGASPPAGDSGYPRTGGCQSCGSSASTSGNPPAGLCVLVVRRCRRPRQAQSLPPRSLQGPSRTLWGNPEPEGDKRRGSARKIGKGAGIFGIHAESEIEVWGWVLPARHPRDSSQKGSGKGSGAAPGASADPPKDPLPPPAPTAEKEKEATQPTQVDEDTAMQDAQAR